MGQMGWRRTPLRTKHAIWKQLEISCEKRRDRKRHFYVPIRFQVRIESRDDSVDVELLLMHCGIAFHDDGALG